MVDPLDYRETTVDSISSLCTAASHGAPQSRSKIKTIEERYQKKTPIEHILHRPESYIGSVQPDNQSLWIWNETKQRMVYKTIDYVPGLYKIFDEILVNAADVKAREGHEMLKANNRQRMTCLKVDIDQPNGTITVFNDGEGIPIEIHKEHNVYVPELIFGHLLTSDNYDDNEQRVTGGRNGYGAKLTNIFSNVFIVECVDTTRHRKFRKTWRNNMSSSDACKITEVKDSKDYVKVTFTPDLSRFQINSFDDDFVALLTKRVYDVAGCVGVKVWLNGKRLGVDGFKNYVDLYFSPSLLPDKDALLTGAPKPPIKIHEKSDRWEVIISMSEGQFQQVSFVNSICTTKGGTHVSYVTDPLVQAILKKVNSKNKGGMEIKAHHVRAHLWIFVNALVVNPTFDSQTKDSLTLKSSQFGSKFVLSEKTINAVIKSDVLESVLVWAKTKQQVELQRRMKGSTGRFTRDRISGIPKLEDANDAGTRHAESCTLILTEGESAKTSCVAGLSVVGRDRYGVFPLRGKLLNVREASFKQQVENQEIQAILKIMGLQVGKKIDSPKGLRYGSLMMMTDQDLDGSHIKGLLINMIAHYWPQLLQYRGFLKEFVTPIVKVSKGKQELPFFTLAEYDRWRTENANGKGWKIRYYKGLGTSTDREFKQYFSQLELHSLDFIFEGEHDLNAIDMAFNGKRAEDRKQWIQSYEDGVHIDHSQKSLSYSEFINKELVVFSKYDAFRSIPNCIDGLKPVQRKVLFAAFKRNLKAEIKVAQFTGYISEITAYHHGEQSLGTTIIGMAQQFVGSNNITLLQPCGQFGSRKEGGKDASAVRYIFTRLSHLARAIFPEPDDALLDYQNDDGLMVEPKYYVPIIPLILANGAEGIGTGWSSSVPNYNPRELIANVRRFMHGEPMEPLKPWYKGFKGTIERKTGGYETVGIINKLDEETLEVTELPIKMWTQNFKQFLEDCMQDRATSIDQNDQAASTTTGRGRTNTRGNNNHTTTSSSNSSFTILDYRDNSTHETIRFTIKMSPSQMQKVESEGLEKAFKLRKPLSTTNMTLFDNNLKVQRYATELDIIREFGQLRLQYYELRREYLIEKLERECRILNNKVRFIEAIISETLKINNRKRELIIHDLLEQKFDTITSIHQDSKILWKLEQQKKMIESEINKDNEEILNEEEQHYNTDIKAESCSNKNENNYPPPLLQHVFKVPAKEYEYLLGMSLWTLTSERIQELQGQLAENFNNLKILKNTTLEELWEKDLVKLEKALDDQDDMDEVQMEENKKFQVNHRASTQALKKGKRTERRLINNKAKVSRTRKTNSSLSNDESNENSTHLLSSSSSDDDDDDDDTFTNKTGAIKTKEARSNVPETKRLNNAVTEAKNNKGASRIWDSLEASGFSSTTTVDTSSNSKKHFSLAERIKLRGDNTTTTKLHQGNQFKEKTDAKTFIEKNNELTKQQTLEEMFGFNSLSTNSSLLANPGECQQRGLTVKRPNASSTAVIGTKQSPLKRRRVRTCTTSEDNDKKLLGFDDRLSSANSTLCVPLLTEDTDILNKRNNNNPNGNRNNQQGKSRSVVVKRERKKKKKEDSSDEEDDEEFDFRMISSDDDD